MKEALVNGDLDYVCRLGLEQIGVGAQILDVNVGTPGIDEAAMAAKAVPALQAITDTPLQIDTSNYEAMERALRLYNGKPMLNSVNGKEDSLQHVLPLAKNTALCWLHCVLTTAVFPLLQQDVLPWLKNYRPCGRIRH